MKGAMTSENMSPVLLRVMVRVSQAKGECKPGDLHETYQRRSRMVESSTYGSGEGSG